MSNPDNFLALEPLLVARLQEQLVDLRPKINVLTAVDLAGVMEETQTTPAVHVVYGDYHVAESRPDGKVYRLEQTWLAVVVTRNMRALRTGADAREDAGLIVRRVIAALGGYQPEMLSKPMRLVDGPKGGFRAGCQYLPTAFTGELVLK